MKKTSLVLCLMAFSALCQASTSHQPIQNKGYYDRSLPPQNNHAEQNQNNLKNRYSDQAAQNNYNQAANYNQGSTSNGYYNQAPAYAPPPYPYYNQANYYPSNAQTFPDDAAQDEIFRQNQNREVK